MDSFCDARGNMSVLHCICPSFLQSNDMIAMKKQVN